MRCTVLGTLLVVGIVAARPSAQSQAPPKPTFEVASIEPAKLTAPFGFRILPGRLIATTVPLIDFIAKAYGIPHWRIVDEPKWVNEQRFDIQATRRKRPRQTKCWPCFGRSSKSGFSSRFRQNLVMLTRTCSCWRIEMVERGPDSMQSRSIARPIA